MFDRFYSHYRHGHANTVYIKVLETFLETSFIGDSVCMRDDSYRDALNFEVFAFLKIVFSTVLLLLCNHTETLHNLEKVIE